MTEPQASGSGRMDTFTPDTPISVTVKLRDESGVGDVTAVYDTEDGHNYVVLRGNGNGQTDATVTLTLSGTSGGVIAPGVYSCSQLEAWDTKGNSQAYARQTHPALADRRFRYEYLGSGQPGDNEGPELID